MTTQEKINNRLKTFMHVVNEFPDFRYLGDSVLRKPTTEVSNQEGQQIGQKLGQILIKYRQIMGFGRGLAANQIGLPNSVFVTFLDDQIQTYINPKIINFSDDQCLYRELCLSSGLVWGDIPRSATITLLWKDSQGFDHEEEFTGAKARLVQHEYEHLMGKYSLDHAEPRSLELCLSDPLLEKLRPA